MTENKRFTFADGFKIVAIRDNGKIMNSKQVCNKLNELNTENKELKLQLGECRHNKLFSRRELEKENKELKETLAFRSNQLALMEQLIDDLGSEEMARQMEEILE